MDSLAALTSAAFDAVSLMVSVAIALGWPGVVLLAILFSIAWQEAAR